MKQVKSKEMYELERNVMMKLNENNSKEYFPILYTAESKCLVMSRFGKTLNDYLK